MKNEKLAEKRSRVEGDCEILRTIFQPRALSSAIPASRKGFIYFITLRIISQGERKKIDIVPAYFVDFFVFLGAELSTSFLICLSLACAKSIFFLFSMTD